MYVNFKRNENASKHVLQTLYKRWKVSPSGKPEDCSTQERPEIFDKVVRCFSSKHGGEMNEIMDEYAYDSRGVSRDAYEQKHYCICSQRLRNVRDIHFVRNVENDNILMIGKECIHKFEFDSRESNSEDESFIDNESQVDVEEDDDSDQDEGDNHEEQPAVSNETCRPAPASAWRFSFMSWGAATQHKRPREDDVYEFKSSDEESKIVPKRPKRPKITDGKSLEEHQRKIADAFDEFDVNANTTNELAILRHKIELSYCMLYSKFK